MPGSVPGAAVGMMSRSAAQASISLRQPKVEDLDASVLRDEEVLRLQVAMDDALLVRGGEALRDLDGVVDRLARRESAPAERLPRRVSPSSSSWTT